MLDRRTCPLTGSTELRQIIETPFSFGALGAWAKERKLIERLADKRFVVFHNPSIDFYFQRFVMDQDEEVGRRVAIADRREIRLLTLSELSHRAEDAMLIRLLHPEGRPRVFDYGMGEGHWAVMASAYGAEVWGTDIDPRSKQVADKSGIHFVSGIEELEDNYFDFINADQVFEHLPDPLPILRQLVAKLRSGGHVKLTTPADRNIEQKLRRVGDDEGYSLPEFKRELHAMSPLSHINLFSQRSLTAMAERAGLEAFRVPLRTCYSVMTGFHSARQVNRNLYNPLKRFRARGTWQFFRKS